MDLTTLGVIAAICTTGAFVPQVIQVVRTKRTADISLGFTALFVFGVFLWLVYGILVMNVPVILSNGVTLPLTAIILGYKLRYG